MRRPRRLAAGHRRGPALDDGGSRSTANLQLAHGSRRVLAIVPIPLAVGPHPSAADQAARLTEDGARVALLSPDEDARRAMGRTMADTARGPAAARAGYEQALRVVTEVADTSGR